MRAFCDLPALHRFWFLSIGLMGVLFIVCMPPFQINDEDSHWVRLWTVASGHAFCGTIPQAASDVMRPLHYKGPNGAAKTARFAYVGAALDYTGSGTAHFEPSTACAYFPAGYLVAAVAARIVGLDSSGQPRRGGMILAALAARLANWLFLSGLVLLALVRLPWGRSFTLFFYSIPEVIQQSVAINVDSFLFGMSLFLLVVVLRRAEWRSIVWVAIATALMAATKPIYVPLALLAAPVLVQLPLRRPLGTKRLVALALLGLPLISYSLWKAIVPAGGILSGIPWWHVDPDKQLALLLHHPEHLFVILWAQARQTFGHDLMRGSWTSILGGFGWSAFEMKMWGYYTLLLGLIAAVAADLYAPARPEPIGDRGGRALFAGWCVALCGIFVIVPGTILAMYLYFTEVGDNSVLGVQGRYYLIPLFMLAMIALYLVKQRHARVPRAHLSMACTGFAALLCVLGNVCALSSIHGYFYP